MEQKIEQLTPAEQDWISQQIGVANEFVGKATDGDSTDLPSPEELDQAFNSWLNSVSHDPADANSVINCVGIAFGQHLVNTTPLQWVIATDNYGTELALYGLPGNGDVLVYPQIFVAKRYEARVGTFIVESIKQIQRDVNKVEARKPSQKWWKPW